MVDNLDDEKENFKYVEKDLQYNKINDENEEICSFYEKIDYNATIIETTIPTNIHFPITFPIPTTTPRTIVGITIMPSGHSENTDTPI